MKNDELVENVVVFNGIEEHRVQYVYSPFVIKNVANWTVNGLPKEFIKEINEKKLRVYIETDINYSKVNFKNLETDDLEMILKFNKLTFNGV